MRINPDDLRRHYASLPDGALLALDRHELTDQARAIYDEEAAKRGLMRGEPGEYGGPLADDGDRDEDFGHREDAADSDDESEPEWLSEAACACTFTVRNPQVNDATADACAALRAARIPCHVTISEEEPSKPGAAPLYSMRLMVPLGLAFNAISVLDHDIFNEEQEAQWRSSFEMLSDDDLQALDPDVMCAGLLDKVTRLKRAYEDELARRSLASRG